VLEVLSDAHGMSAESMKAQMARRYAEFTSRREEGANLIDLSHEMGISEATAHRYERSRMAAMGIGVNEQARVAWSRAMHER